MLSDEKLERKTDKEEERKVKQIKAVYKRALLEITEKLRPMLHRLKAASNVPAPLYITDSGLQDWKEEKQREVLRGSDEIEKSSRIIVDAGEKSKKIAFDFLRHVHDWNVDEVDVPFWMDGMTRISFDSFTSQQECRRRLSMLFAPLVGIADFFSKAIKKLVQFVTSIASRVKNLFRTLVKRIQNFARIKWMECQNAHMQEGEKPCMKQWIAIIDDVTRDSHREMDGQIKPLNKPFITGAGNEIMFPGDTNAPIEEWINCRCNVRRIQET